MIFENQNGEQLSFSLKSFEDEKESYSGGGGGFGPPTSGGGGFYYDTRNIIFLFDQYNSGLSELRFKFNRIYDTLRGNIRFPLWNTDQFYLSGIRIDFEVHPIQMNINNTIFKNVIILNSNSIKVLYDIGTFSRNVNVLYYDLFEGLIGFDDLEGNEWRLQ